MYCLLAFVVLLPGGSRFGESAFRCHSASRGKVAASFYSCVVFPIVLQQMIDEDTGASATLELIWFGICSTNYMLM